MMDTGLPDVVPDDPYLAELHAQCTALIEQMTPPTRSQLKRAKRWAADAERRQNTVYVPEELREIAQIVRSFYLRSVSAIRPRTTRTHRPQASRRQRHGRPAKAQAPPSDDPPEASPGVERPLSRQLPVHDLIDALVLGVARSMHAHVAVVR